MNKNLVINYRSDVVNNIKNISLDVVLLYNDDSLVGCNIFNADKYFDKELLTSNYLYPTQELISRINELAQIDFKLDEEFHGVVCGEIKSAEVIEGTHLQKCLVDVGYDQLQIVCGAANARVGLKTAVATVNTMMPNGDLIKPSKLMNIPSFGMLCSQKELNLIGYNPVGIIELDPSTVVGSLIKDVYSNLK
nr:tRNA-binding protein [Ureaplasma diversum]